MIRDRWQQVSQLYHAALAKPVTERRAFLADASAGDEQLREEVESLLAQDSTAEDFLAAPAFLLPSNILRAELSNGTHLGPYEILSPAGAGGMGQVYKARDSRLKRFVAIKILPPEFSTDRERKRRFDYEAQVIAGLNHPHICTLHDVGHQRGMDYLVMEYLDGQTLRRRLEQPRVLLDEALNIATQIADALSQAHDQSIIHRDLKPENIMLTKAGAKLLDFGLAKIVPTLDSTAIHQHIVAGGSGTMAYMSPEQVRRLHIDARSDVFSFGVVLYEMFTGTLPFAGSNISETIDAILHKRPDSISTGDCGITAELTRLIYKCLEKAPEHRFPSAKELLGELRQLRRTIERTVSVHDATVRRHNLPLHLTKFIGRESQIEELHRTLGERRLLTMTGSGGCGKTRLGLKVASEVAGEFTDGVWLVQLGPLSDPGLVPQAVASALGVQHEPGRPLTQRLTDYLESKQLLLVFDNCEHLAAACATLVDTLLNSCIGLKIIATSRQPLHAPGEMVWRVPSLSFPDTQMARSRVPDFSNYESVRLFVDRARHVSSFELNETNAVAVAEICHRLDGIPLALEMAAARLNVLSVHQIAERLRDRFQLLAGPMNSLPRQQTLRRTIDWSYSLLSRTEQTLFQRLAVFSGNFSLDAAEAVVSKQDLDSGDLLNILSRLVEQSMVVVDHMHLEARYRMLETLREYGLEKLREQGEETRTLERHAEFFVTLAERAEPELHKSEAVRWYDRLELDQQNILRALEWCHSTEGRSLTALRLAGALHQFWVVRGQRYYGHLKTILLRALDDDCNQAPKMNRAKALGTVGVLFEDLNTARLLHEESLRLWTELGDEEGIAGACYRLGGIALRQNDASRAGTLQEQSLEIYRRRDNKVGVAACLDDLGYLAFSHGDYKSADSRWRESLELWREVKVDRGIAISLSNNASLAKVRADYVRAEALCVESLSLSKRLGDEAAVAHRLTQLAALYFDSDYTRAGALFQEGLSVFRSLGFKRAIAGTLLSLSDLVCCEGGYERARGWLNESLTLYGQLGDGESPNAAECLVMLGVIAFEQGDYESALDLSQRSAELLLRLSRTAGFANSLCRIGWARLARDDHEGARAAFEESLRLARQSGRVVGFAEPHCGVGYLELLKGNDSEAWSHFQEAFVSYEQRNDRTGMVYSLLPLGDVALARGEHESALHLYDRALKVSVDMGFKKGIARALRSLGTAAAQQRRPEHAARHFGACDAVLEAIGGKLPAFQSGGYDAAEVSARSSLGEDQFEQFWREGRTMPLQSVLASG